MVLALEESYREQIEFEYGSIVEFKRDVHKAMSVFNQEQLQKVPEAIYEAIYEALRKCGEAIYEALRKCAEAIIEIIKKIAESLTEALQPAIENIRELTMGLYDTNGFLPLNEDLYIAPIQKHAPVMKLNKVPVNYSMNVRAPKIPHRCRSNC